MAQEPERHVLLAALQPGNLLQILFDSSEEGKGPPRLSLEYAVVNSADSNDLFVQYLEPIADEEVVEEDGEAYDPQDVLKLSDDVHATPPESINRHWSIDDSTPETFCSSMRKAGLQPIVPDDAPDDGHCQYYERLTDDWVVDDDDPDAEPFAQADASTLSPSAAAYVEETHKAVRQFESWNPQTQEERNIKRYVEDLAGRAQHENEDKRLRAGLAPLGTYKNPAAQL